MGLKRKVLESALMPLRQASMARIKIMPWEISWFPTFGCNLRCSYCNSIKGKQEPMNPQKCVDKIIELAPASISILGGEPYIVPKMVEYLEQLREGLPNLFILMTSNGMLNKDLLVRSMSLVSSMCISMDGLGEHTSKQREGSDPDVILESIKACAAERKRLNYSSDLVVNSVVTRGNAEHLPEFYKIIHDIDPHILCFSQGMQPFDSPESIGSDPELANEYLRKVAELKKSMRILLAGRLADGELLKFESKEICEEEIHHRMTENEPHECYQERFNSFMSPSGNLYTCRRYAGINSCRMDLVNSIRDKRPWHGLKAYASLWMEFVAKNPTHECVRFCGCPEWMNGIMNAKSEEQLPPEIFRIRGRISPERIRESGEFIRKHVNPDFKDEFLIAKSEISDQPAETGSVTKCKIY